jgi:parallel beta-helix repeat protein
MKTRVFAAVAFLSLFTLPAAQAIVTSECTIIVSPTGSDSNPGTVAAPVATIAKGLSLASPGAAVCLRAGTYRQTATLTKSGTSSAPITLGNYNYEVATISGSDVVSASLWKGYSGQVYVAQLPSTYTTIGQVFVDGTMLPLAQYPTFPSVTPYPASGWLTVTSNSTSLSRVTSTHFPSEDLAGAGIHVRTNNYSIDDGTISSYNTATDTATLTGNLIHIPVADYGFYIDNKSWMLTQASASPGWAFDPSTHQLYILLPDNASPSAHTIEISYRGGISVNSGVNYFTINGLYINETSGTAVNIPSSTGFNLFNSNISNTAGNAIVVGGTGSGDIRNNIIKNVVNDAITFGTSTSSGFQVISNTITNNGPPRKSYAAINMTDTLGSTVENNTITNAGYLGIRFNRNAIIKNNIITNVCQVLADCGAIYAWEPVGTPFNLAATLEGNVVTGTSMYDGAPSAAVYYGTPNTVAPGHAVYLDNLAQDVTISNNVFYGNFGGVLLHDGADNAVTSNTFFGNYESQVLVIEDTSEAEGSISGCTIEKNLMIATNSNPSFLIESSYNNSYTSMGTFDSNTFAGVASSVNSEEFDVAYFKNAAGVQLYPLARWQATGEDTHSTVGPIYAPWLATADGSNLISNGSFSSSISPWSVFSTNATAKISWDSSCGGPTGYCMDYLGSSTSTSPALAASNSFTLTEGDTYYLQFISNLATDNTSYLATTAEIPAVIARLAGSPYTELGMSQNFYPTYNTWQTFRGVFRANATTDGAVLEFQNTVSMNLLIANVVLERVTVKNETPTQDFAILTNPSASSASVACPDSTGAKCSYYMDVHGNPVTFPVTLPAYGAEPLFLSNSSYIEDK